MHLNSRSVRSDRFDRRRVRASTEETPNGIHRIDTHRPRAVSNARARRPSVDAHTAWIFPIDRVKKIRFPSTEASGHCFVRRDPLVASRATTYLTTTHRRRRHRRRSRIPNARRRVHRPRAQRRRRQTRCRNHRHLANSI